MPREAPLHPIRVTLTPKEAAELHMAAELTVKALEAAGSPRREPLERAIATLERDLTKAGAQRTPSGWEA